MLRLLFLAQQFSKGSGAAQAYTLDSRAASDSCNDINSCRRLFDIVWGCLTTIFACTWVSVHPNVPPPDQSMLALLWRRLRLMVLAIFVPEIIVGFAARQFLVARAFSKKRDVSITHGFFFSMGGFVSQAGHPIATSNQLEHPEYYLTAIKQVKRSHIMDKSKGDALSKGVALAQGLWFTTQCLARVSQHLPFTALEVATLAFAVVNVFIWVLWWGKPLDAQQPIPVGPPEELPEAPNLLALRGSTDWRQKLSGYYPRYNPLMATSVPIFWSGEHPNQTGFSIQCLIGTVFGAIHCTAWKANFPSAEELWIWRICSVLITGLPLFILLLGIIWDSLTEDVPFYDGLLNITSTLSFAAYMIARLFLLILPFTTLRALPRGAFRDVDWTVYIPHL
ncbi:hypothetical protein GGX14DRAFT_578513 [Mycena pura]|uniref:Uncharacterized protein n=1 Tax=Mycena pura TaxID=153505 RepID=A0AAD6UPS5_9AGAR|nr:hypothetical protein GGX14DRAFT_578513 [Mycena pura]